MPRSSTFQRIDIPISREIETKYDDIKTVVDNIQSVININNFIDSGDINNIIDIATDSELRTNVNAVAPSIDNVNTVANNIDNVNIDANNIDSINLVADVIRTGSGYGGGQYLGNGLAKGIEYMSQESIANDNIVVVSGTNAMSIDSFTLIGDATLTIEDNATYKVI